MWIYSATLARADESDDREIPNVVVYSPSLTPVQGQLPVNSSYPVKITAPLNLPAQPTPISFTIAATSIPTGASATTAAQYVTVSPSTLIYNVAGEQKTITVSVALPTDAVAGSYTFKIVAVGWPNSESSFNQGTQINATVTAPPLPKVPPTVTIAKPLGGSTVAAPSLPVAVDFDFSAVVPAGPGATNISSVTYELDGSSAPIALTSLTGVGSSLTVRGIGTLSVSTAGLHKVVVKAFNEAGNGVAESSFTVQVAGPPVVRITSPGPQQVFAYDALAARPAIPFTFNATSVSHNLTGYTAQLNGSSLAPSITGLNTPALSGSVLNLSNAAVGSNSLTVTATDAGNRTTTASSTFVVNPIHVTILAPTDTLVLPAGVLTGSADFKFTVKSDALLPISDATAKLDGSGVVVSAGLGGSDIVATGTLTNLTIGEHHFEATGVSSSVPVTRAKKFWVKGTPVIDWPTPASIVYGTGISDAQLNAKAKLGGQEVAGTMTYSVALNTKLATGTHTLTATFTPNEPNKYCGASGSVNLVVTPATLLVSANSFNLAHGEAIPVLTASYTGFKNGDDEGDLEGAPALSTQAIQGSPAGDYPIAIKIGTLASRNYLFVLSPGTLRIERSIFNLSSAVFLDLDADGVQDPGEGGLPKIIVELRKGTTATLAETSLDGSYVFTVDAGSYDVEVIVPLGMKVTTVKKFTGVSVTGDVTLQPRTGLTFDFNALRGYKADGFTIGYWKNNLEKLRDGKNGSQVSLAQRDAAFVVIRTLALDLYNATLTPEEAIRLMSSTSSAPIDLLQKQLVAAELNCGNEAFIGGSEELTRAFIAWGEMLVKQPPTDGSVIIFAQEWFDAYNNSHGGKVAGPLP